MSFYFHITSYIPLESMHAHIVYVKVFLFICFFFKHKILQSV